MGNESRVWASDAMVNVRMLRPITYSFNDETLSVDDAIKIYYRNVQGESLSPELFPPAIFPAGHSKTNYIKLPHLFFANCFWVVSGEVADVMARFDLGEGHLYPTNVVRKDRKTPIGDRWFCFNFGNVKDTLVAEQSRSIRRLASEAIDIWRPPFDFEGDDQLALSAAALEGPDIWIEARLKETFFVSDRLRQALKAERLARPFGFQRCRIV